MRPNNAGKFLTAAQKTAWESGDRKAVQTADDAALAQAVLASLSEVETVQIQNHITTEDDLIQAAIAESLKPSEKGASPVDPQQNAATYLDLQAQKTTSLRTWFTQSGFDIVRNSGGGSNNCLLISLLQHVTGDYSSEHLVEVSHYRSELMQRDKTIEKNDPLPSSGKHIEDLIDLILEEKKCTRRFAIAGPGLGSEPSWHFYGKGKEYAIIFDQSGHYEAVIPRRTKSS